MSGIFTDSDLARLLERQEDRFLDQPVSQVMSADPKTITSGERTAKAIEILSAHNLSELPVINGDGQPLGIIDITDVVSVL